MERPELTAKQRTFCEEYVKHYNKMAAYRSAYPDASDATVARNACKMLKTPKIAEYVEKLQKEILRQAALNPTKLLLKLNEILDDKEATNSEKMKAVELLQKQMGLQTQKAEVEVKTTVIDINLEDGEEQNTTEYQERDIQ